MTPEKLIASYDKPIAECDWLLDAIDAELSIRSEASQDAGIILRRLSLQNQQREVEKLKATYIQFIKELKDLTL